MTAQLHSGRLVTDTLFVRIPDFKRDFKRTICALVMAREGGFLSTGSTTEIAFQREALAWIIADWLRIGDVRPRPLWRGEQPTLVLSSPGLFGALAIQLLLAMQRSDGVATGSSCGRAYTPVRRPKQHQRRYCPECRDAGAP